MDIGSFDEEHRPAVVNTELSEVVPPTGTFQLTRRHCTEDTLESWTQYLNNELTVLGFQSILKQSEAVEAERDAAGSVDVVQLVGCLYELLQQHRADTRGRDIMEDQFQRCQSDKEQLIVVRDRLKNDLAGTERELDSAVQQQHRLEEQMRMVNMKLQSDREELKKVRSVMLQRSVQYNHEVKKWERESSRLKEKLHQVLSDRSQDRKIGIEMVNVVQRDGGKRRMWKTATKHEEEMYKVVIANLEERQKELIEENTDLRDSLVKMQQELISLLTASKPCQMDTQCADDEVSLPQFQMPYELVREGIETSLKEKWDQLREQVSQLEKLKVGTSDYPIRQTVGVKLEASSDVAASHVKNRSPIADLQEMTSDFPAAITISHPAPAVTHTKGHPLGIQAVHGVGRKSGMEPSIGCSSKDGSMFDTDRGAVCQTFLDEQTN